MVRAFHVLMWLLYICVSQVKERLKKMGTLQPLNIFLRQEIDRMQKVISIVRSTLMDLKLAIDGTIIMSENLRDALDNIFDARVPNTWKKVSGRAVFFIVTVSGRGWRLVATVKENSFFMILQIVCNVQIPPPPPPPPQPPFKQLHADFRGDLLIIYFSVGLFSQISWQSTTLGFWFTDLLDRNGQFSSWLFDGRPTCFWMTGFFNPQVRFTCAGAFHAIITVGTHIFMHTHTPMHACMHAHTPTCINLCTYTQTSPSLKFL